MPQIAQSNKSQNVHSTRALQRATIAALRQVGTYKAAAELVGIDPHTITRWCHKSPEFRQLADEACDFADKYVIADDIRSSFHKRAIAGKEDQQSAVIGMFLLKKADPRYRDNANVSVNLAGPVAIQFNLTPQPSEAKQIEQAETEEPSSTT